MNNSTYTVTGMTCDHCVSAVTTEVSNLPGEVKVDVDLPRGQVLVVSDEPLDDAAVRSAVVEAGYEVTS
ncbi:MAG: heavy-metal-associated domain-containing protein [Acidimicrobiales bacterium]